LLVDRRIRIREAQTHKDPTDPDPQHCLPQCLPVVERREETGVVPLLDDQVGDLGLVTRLQLLQIPTIILESVFRIRNPFPDPAKITNKSRKKFKNFMF
jgi:hypothetical protein